MAIPPIISNNPLLKLFRTEQQSGAGKSKQPVATAQTPEDIVEISEAARERLDGIQDLSARKQDDVRQTAAQTGDILGHNQDLTLGLDPGFSS